jgi:hypothetical protein
MQGAVASLASLALTSSRQMTQQFRVSPPLTRIMRARMKSTHYAGESIGDFILIEPLGNPELGPALYWSARHTCGRIRRQAVVSMGRDLKKLKYCGKECQLEHGNIGRKLATSEPPAVE